MRVMLFAVLFLESSHVIGTELPALKFIPNRNQWAPHVQFSVSLPGGAMNLAPGRFNYYFIDGEKLQHPYETLLNPDGGTPLVNVHAIQVDFVNANTSPRVEAFGRSAEHYNYFLGNEPAKWAANVPAYAGLFYYGIYDDIDLKVYSSGRRLKYDFVLAPGADPSRIMLAYHGAESMRIDDGDLLVTTTLGELREKRPLAWQYIAGKRVTVACAYVLRGNLLTFSFPEGYDPCYELTIDPLLIFSTYSGSTADNWGSTATPGEHGNLYSAGATRETLGGKFPATSGVFQTTSGASYDIGILKYDSTGSSLLYATYLGGAGLESAHSLVMDSNRDLIVLGTTSSVDFATTPGAFDQTFNGGDPVAHVYEMAAPYDLFVCRISDDGSILKASSYFGGARNDGLGVTASALTQNYGDELRGDIITDGAGNVYVSSVTSSPDFPMANSFSTAYAGGSTDAILLKLSADLSQVLWGAYIGGSSNDAAYTIQLDNSGSIFVAGGTQSADFPATSGTYQPTFVGKVDGWIAKVASDGSAILGATYMGTAETDQIYFLDLNADGEPHVFGLTNAGSSIPKIPLGNVFNRSNGGQFVQKYSNDLSSLIVSTTFGSGRGIPDISPTAFLVNECGNLYMSGWAGSALNQLVGGWETSTVGLPVSNDAFQSSTSGSDFYFLVLTDDASEFLYGTYLGGSISRTHVDGGTSRFDKGGIVYHAVCAGCAFNDSNIPVSDFPTTPGVWSNTNNSQNCNNAAFKFDLSSLKARIRTNSESLADPGVSALCLPDKYAFENFSTGGQQYVWDFGDGTQEVVTTKDPVVHEYQTPGNYVVRMKAIDVGTCSEVDSTQTVVTVFAAASHVQEDDDHCFGTPYALSAGGGAAYEWRTPDGGIFSTLPNPSVAPADTTMYLVTIREANGCIRRDSVTINVIPSVEPEFTFERQPGCSDRPVIRLVNETDSTWATDRLYFDFGDGHVSDDPVADHYFEADGVYRVKLVANREFCVYEASVDIPVIKYLVPNVITPDDDATNDDNDRFTIEFGKGTGKTPGDYGFNVSLWVYNRWGETVYQADDYQYDWAGDGLAAGVYFYEVEIEGHGTCRSWLHIMR